MLPPFEDNQSLANDEVLEIFQYAIPSSWNKEMRRQGFDPLKQSLKEFISILKLNLYQSILKLKSTLVACHSDLSRDPTRITKQAATASSHRHAPRLFYTAKKKAPLIRYNRNTQSKQEGETHHNRIEGERKKHLKSLDYELHNILTTS